LINHIDPKLYQAVIITVAHQEFFSINYQEFKDNDAVIFDTKSIIDRKFADARL
jgi:UDP-N-acetyl-D-galactosamine dehydrogenase